MWRVKVLLRSYEARELGCVIVVQAFARGGEMWCGAGVRHMSLL